jgi:hypothetical protein
VSPSVSGEERRDPLVIPEPDRDVDVVMRSCDRPGVEVDRPAAEQPVIEAALCKEFVQVPECGELGY